MQQLTLSSIGDSLINEISSSRNEPRWLKEYRNSALSIYQELPPEVSPLYNKYSDAKRMNPEQVSLSINTDSKIPEFLTKRIDEVKNQTSIIQIGSNIHSVNLSDKLQSSGVVISSINDALTQNNEIVEKVIKSSNSKEDKYTALNNAAFNTGLFVYIPKNLIIEEPIHLLSCLSGDGISTVSRNLIVAEDNTKATIVQELYSPKIQTQQAYLELLNTSVGSNSNLDLTTLQMMEQNSINFSTRRTDLSQDSKINLYLGLFGTMLSRYWINMRSCNYTYIFFFEKSESRLNPVLCWICIRIDKC